MTRRATNKILFYLLKISQCIQLFKPSFKQIQYEFKRWCLFYVVLWMKYGFISFAFYTGSQLFEIVVIIIYQCKINYKQIDSCSRLPQLPVNKRSSSRWLKSKVCILVIFLYKSNTAEHLCPSAVLVTICGEISLKKLLTLWASGWTLNTRN